MKIIKKFQVFFLVFLLPLLGQGQALEFLIVDSQTKEGIENTHCFFSQSEYGAFSNRDGRVVLNIETTRTEDLIISHIGYQVQVINFDLQELESGDTIFLVPQAIELDGLTITAKESNIRKKRMKKFIRSFVGSGKPAQKVKILNPEVLRFEEKQGNLIATATDLLHLQNEYLGYEIYYFLQFFELKPDGSISYLGKSRFLDISEQLDVSKIEGNRLKTFNSSSKHFFQSLINRSLIEDEYLFRPVSYHEGQFSQTDAVIIDSMLLFDGVNYKLKFPEFLEIVNKRVKTIAQVGGSHGQKSHDKTRSTGSSSGEKAQVNYATSYLYKVSDALVISPYGNILNSTQVKEYGFWADLKMAYQLPWDYGDDFITSNNDGVILNQGNNEVQQFVELLLEEKQSEFLRKLNKIRAEWKEEYLPCLLEVYRFRLDNYGQLAIKEVLVDVTGQDQLVQYYDWMSWLWEQEDTTSDLYVELKGSLNGLLDERFAKYFSGRSDQIRIRLDEVMWGGVLQDGIPPLRYPKFMTPDRADYLADSDVVFGVVIDGIPKAYPKRILAWHEMAVDRFKDTEIALVYCTLCGTVITYDVIFNDVKHTLGTSGFLYRSNKLMYDKETQSLWNTIEGKPVIGPLVDRGIELVTYPVVTSTWGAWKAAHPETQVLSLDTGHKRDYDEGAAYYDYFATDRLMFPVPFVDHSLKNKQEVMVIRTEGYTEDPVAFSVDHFSKNQWHQNKINGVGVVLVKDEFNILRAYESGEFIFNKMVDKKLKDNQGGLWEITEDGLIKNGLCLKQLPSHQIFWFAWYTTFPNTRLVK